MRPHALRGYVHRPILRGPRPQAMTRKAWTGRQHVACAAPHTACLPKPMVYRSLTQANDIRVDGSITCTKLRIDDRNSGRTHRRDKVRRQRHCAAARPAARGRRPDRCSHPAQLRCRGRAVDWGGPARLRPDRRACARPELGPAAHRHCPRLSRPTRSARRALPGRPGRPAPASSRR